MRKIEYEIINGEMYEIVRRISIEKFKRQELGMEDVHLLKECFNCTHIFKQPQTNQYLFTIKIEELHDIQDEKVN